LRLDAIAFRKRTEKALNGYDETAGGVIWITGLAQAGKTTTARTLAAALKTRGRRPVLLDGDAMRVVLDDFGYAADARRRLAFTYARLAREISTQGFLVVVATISLFHDVHEWNRRNIENYFEVFLEAPLEWLSARNGAGVYAQSEGQPLVGVDVEPEWPVAPDLRICANDGLTPDRISELILGGLRKGCGF
jgi:cytidine diphosphoramidate kinase